MMRDSGTPAPVRVSPPALLAAGTVGIAALALYLVTMGPTMTWWFGGSDSGDLSSAAYELGIPHPTGYPLFMLLGWLVTRIPAGDVALRINVMDTVLGALAAGAVTLLAGRLAAREGRYDRWTLAAMLLTGLGLAAGELYWSQAYIVEVYILHAALCILIFWAWTRADRNPALLGAAHGLALTNHSTSVLLLGAAAVAYGLPWRRWWGRRGMLFAAGLIAPLILYALLPLRAAAGPDANWGDPDTPGRFLAHISGRQYGGLLGWSQPAAVARDVVLLLLLVVQSLPPWSVPVAALGLRRLWRENRRYAVFTMTVLVLVWAFTALYRTVDKGPYMLPAFIVVSLWSAIGLVEAARWLVDRPGQRLGAVALLAAVLLFSTVRTTQNLNLRADDSAIVFARQTLEELPPGATYYAARDDVTLSLWYAQRVLNVRRDVHVIDVRAPSVKGLP